MKKKTAILILMTILFALTAFKRDKVFCIYADDPVCDIKSWSGGMFYGKGSPEEWNTCMNAYGLDSLSVKNYKDIPINNCVSIAEAGITSGNKPIEEGKSQRSTINVIRNKLGPKIFAAIKRNHLM